MKNKDILARCEREIQNSTSHQMLEVAKRYSDLFLLKIVLEGADPVEVGLVQGTLQIQYINKYKSCH